MTSGAATDADESLNIFDVFAFCQKWRRLILAITVGSVVCIGVIVPLVVFREYQSRVPLEFVPSSADVVTKVSDLNSSLISVFGQSRLANSFASTFIGELEAIAGDADNTRHADAAAALELWRQQFEGAPELEQYPEAERLRIGFASYLSGPMIERLRVVRSLPKTGFAYIVYAPNDSSWNVFVSSRTPRLAFVVGQATAKAMSMVIHGFNVTNQKLLQQMQINRASNFSVVFKNMQSEYITPTQSIEAERAKLWLDIYELEKAISSIEAKNKSKTQDLQRIPSGLQAANQPLILQTSESLSKLSISLEAMRTNSLLTRLTTLASLTIVTADELKAFLGRLNKIASAISSLHSAGQAQESSLATVQDALSSALAQGLTPNERFLLADAEFNYILLESYERMERVDQRDRNFGKWLLVSVVVGPLLGAGVGMGIEVMRRSAAGISRSRFRTQLT
jgi:hypothetical protein